MKAVILAGGLGTRLKPFTEIIPKPLLPIGESSVLEIQILTLRKYGFDEIFIATNYKADYLEAYLGDGSKYGMKLVFSRERMPLGTCGPLSLLRDALAEPFLMMNGDILTTMSFQRLADFGTRIDADLTVVTKEITTPFHFGKVCTEGDYVVRVEEKPNFKLEILAGIYFLKPKVLDMIRPNTVYGIDSLIKDMIEQKRKIAKYLIQDYWLDIGNIENYEIAQKAYHEHFATIKVQQTDVNKAA